MLYQAYQAHADIMAPVRALAGDGREQLGASGSTARRVSDRRCGNLAAR